MRAEQEEEKRYLRGLVEARQPADLGGTLLVPAAAAQRQQRPLGDQQHVPHMQVDVLLPLLLVVVQRPVLEALRAHPAVRPGTSQVLSGKQSSVRRKR